MDTLDNWRYQLEYSTLVLADKTRLAAALANNDFDTANSLAVEQKKVLDIDYLLVTDESGRVVGGNGRFGTDLSNSHAVKAALNGEKEYTYESTELYDYSLVYAYPIKSGSSVVGSVIGTFSMVDGEFVDSIKNIYK
ncbi:cache domain-containing protein [Treponema sp.]|uniref:cache domain-containing protein n=1 Tax=Treponema sp. TaxID=166 RepID=UPI00389040D7